jgi:hypothetical protein
VQLKSCKLFIFGMFHLMFSDWGGQLVTETMENKTVNKGNHCIAADIVYYHNLLVWLCGIEGCWFLEVGAMCYLSIVPCKIRHSRNICWIDWGTRIGWSSSASSFQGRHFLKKCTCKVYGVVQLRIPGKYLVS